MWVWVTQSTRVSSHLGWKEGFHEHDEIYRKRDRSMRDYFQEKAKQEMKQMLVEIMANPNSKISNNWLV